MKRDRLYSESEAMKTTGYCKQELERKSHLGLIKAYYVNGKKYYKIKANKQVELKLNKNPVINI